MFLESPKLADKYDNYETDSMLLDDNVDSPINLNQK